MHVPDSAVSPGTSLVAATASTRTLTFTVGSTSTRSLSE